MRHCSARVSIVATMALVILCVGLLAYERKGRKRTHKKGNKRQRQGSYHAPALLTPLPHARKPWQLGNSGRPMREDFATMIDRAASLPLDEEISCHARDGYDLAGHGAFVWGLGFHVNSAAECCQACAAHRRTCSAAGAHNSVFWTATLPPAPGPRRCSEARVGCNAWTYCPGSNVIGATDRCFSYSMLNHSRGECWLKHEPNESSPVAVGPRLPEKMLAAPRRDWPLAVSTQVWPWPVPANVEWQAGILAARGARVWERTIPPDWYVKFCQGTRGPC